MSEQNAVHLASPDQICNTDVRLFVREFYFVRTITRHRFELESPNLHQTCIMGYSQLVLKIEVIALDLQGHFGNFELEF